MVVNVSRGMQCSLSSVAMFCGGRTRRPSKVMLSRNEFRHVEKAALPFDSRARAVTRAAIAVRGSHPGRPVFGAGSVALYVPNGPCSLGTNRVGGASDRTGKRYFCTIAQSIPGERDKSSRLARAIADRRRVP